MSPSTHTKTTKGKSATKSRKKIKKTPEEGPNKVVLGVDPASSNLGYAIVHTDGSPIKNKYGSGSVVYGNLERSHAHLERNSAFMFVGMLELMMIFGVEVIAIEGAYRSRFRNVDRAFGAVHASIWNAATLCGMLSSSLGNRCPDEMRYVNIRQTRSTLGLPGKATKLDIAREILKVYNVTENVDDNVTDAIAVAYAYLKGHHTKKKVLIKEGRNILVAEDLRIADLHW